MAITAADLIIKLETTENFVVSPNNSPAENEEVYKIYGILRNLKISELDYTQFERILALLEEKELFSWVETLEIKASPALKQLPAGIGILTSLQHLYTQDVFDIECTSIPETIGNCAKLQELTVRRCADQDNNWIDHDIDVKHIKDRWHRLQVAWRQYAKKCDLGNEIPTSIQEIIWDYWNIKERFAGEMGFQAFDEEHDGCGRISYRWMGPKEARSFESGVLDRLADSVKMLDRVNKAREENNNIGHRDGEKMQPLVIFSGRSESRINTAEVIRGNNNTKRRDGEGMQPSLSSPVIMHANNRSSICILS